MAGKCGFLKRKLLTTLLFVGDQVILTASQDCLQKSLYQLSDVASEYNQIMSTSKTKILAMRRTDKGENNNNSGTS
jgi:uncharacterized membrane protein required for colicin V production